MSQQTDQISNRYKELLQEDINNIQSIEDAAPLIRAFKIDDLKQLLHQTIQTKDSDFLRSFACESVSINKIIPDDVFMCHILSYLPLLLPRCKVNIVNKHWNKMCRDWSRIHYNGLNKTFKDQEDPLSSNNIYNNKSNSTWLMYSAISCNKSILTKIEREFKFKIFKPGMSKIKDGDRVILFPGIYQMNSKEIFRITHSISIIGVYPQTILKLYPANNQQDRVFIHPGHTMFLLGNHNNRLNVFIKNIKVEGIKMYTFCDVISSTDLSIDNCSINYKYYGIKMDGFASAITLNNASIHGRGPCIQMNITGPCSLNMTNCNCFVDYGLLRYTKGESFIIGPTTNLDSSFIGRIEGGCISIWEIPDDQGIDPMYPTGLELCCESNIFQSDIYPVGMRSITVDQSQYTLQDNKWTFSQPRIDDNFDPDLMCSSSKYGLTKCLLPTDVISPDDDVCDGCGDQTHGSCFYQGNEQEDQPKLCYMCYVIKIQKSTIYNNNKHTPVTIIHSKHKIMDEICQHQFKQPSESLDRYLEFENVTHCCKCSMRLDDNMSRWHCGNDGKTFWSNSHQKTKWYCHMTICQQCYNSYGSALNPKT